MKITTTILLLFLALSLSAQAADIGFAGDVTGVSTYVWRGVKQFDGASLQGTAEFSYGIVSVSYWIAGLNWEEVPVETDYYIGVSLPTGPVETSAGATLYSFDHFAKAEYTVYEIYASLGLGPASLGFFYSPSQDNLDESVYWLELGGGTTFKGADLSATLGYGTYSNFVNDSDDAVATLLLGAGKTMGDFAVSWNWAVGLSEGMSNTFYLSAGYGF